VRHEAPGVQDTAIARLSRDSQRCGLGFCSIAASLVVFVAEPAAAADSLRSAALAAEPPAVRPQKPRVMTAKAELLKAAFHLNMGRINGMVRVLESHETLKRTTAFGPSSGVRADILRSVVVFLHATFEVALRGHVPRPGRSWSFYSRADLEKALTSSRIDPASFRFLYPPLTQMAKRRKRIVHEADLLQGEPLEWSVADDWQLLMWLMAVPTFYYQLLISLREANAVERAMHEKLQTAMASHVAFGKQLLSFAEVPQELQEQALREVAATLASITSTLHLDPQAFVTTSG